MRPDWKFNLWDETDAYNKPADYEIMYPLEYQKAWNIKECSAFTGFT